MGVGKFCFGAYPSAEMKQRDGLLTYHYPSPHYEEKSSPSPSFSRISPTLVWIIVTLAAIFFISGLIHLLIRYLIKKRPSFSMIYHSNRYQDTTRPQSLQGQLQQLFHLHDSGLDQPSIDSLPVFGYRDIMGSKEPFDCAVCLSEFSFQDKLRLLPICGHAFHIDCIGTWLLSNSTCPLCRATLLGSGLSMENPFPYFNEQHSRELSEPAIMSGEVAETACNKHEVSVADNKIMTESGELEKRVFSVRLGKLRSFNDDQQIEGGREQIEEGGPSLDARRCYSMGSYQYVVGDISLQVSFPEGRRISGRSARGESLSVSKVWLWTKRSKVPGSLDTPMWLPSNNASLGLSTGDTSQYL